MIRQRGFTLIELTVFIVVMGIIMASIFIPLHTILLRSPKDLRTAEANALAKSRLAVIEGEYARVGFSGMIAGAFSCSGMAVCDELTTPSGYEVTSTITDNWEGSSHYKLATVAVSGLANAELNYVMADKG